MADSDGVREQYNAEARRSDLSELKDFARWNFISAVDWTTLCRRSADFAGIKDGDQLFEAGCGSGAFLAEIAAYRKVSLAGVDFAENLIAIASSRLVGDFRVADITDLKEIHSASYDKVLSHGVFLYLDTQEAARRAALEMIRIAKPGGTIYIGVVNDPERRAEYAEEPSGMFILPRSFWRQLADEKGLKLEVVDQDSIYSQPTGYDAYSRIRYSLLLHKP